MMPKNFVKEKLLSGESVIGIWSILNFPTTVEIGAQAGLDFQILDMEHGVYDLVNLENCIRACEFRQCSPLVRVPGLQPTVIQNCLDMGAHGIIVPQIKNYEEALNVISATKFMPTGARGFNPFTRAGEYNPTLSLSSTRLNNAFGLTSIILENKAIYAELDKLVKIPELDLFYLGIYDLSFDLGYSGNVDHPDVQEYVMKALVKIKNAGKFSGLMVRHQQEINAYRDLDVNVMVYGVDTHLYYSAIKNNVAHFKKQREQTVT